MFGRNAKNNHFVTKTNAAYETVTQGGLGNPQSGDVGKRIIEGAGGKWTRFRK
jgi:hypothetical protein